MEDKLDNLSEAIISMARIEERLVSVDKRIAKIDDLFKKFDERMDDIKRQAIARGQKIAFAERFFWMIMTGAVGLCFVYFR
jgi:signal transduction histidine kinase